jgi:preprotein translocase subunit YajC
MIETLWGFVGLWAQAEGAAPKAGGGAAGGGDPGANFLVTLIPLIPAIVLFYLMFERPRARQEAARRKMLTALKKNDRVMTTAGIYGTVVSVDSEGDRVVVRVDDEKGIKLTFSRASIARVDVPEKEGAASGS